MNYKLVNFCEINEYASKSYSRIYNIDESLNLKDITKIDVDILNDFDLLVGGSPCQSFSIAGKTEGAKYICSDCGHEYNPLKLKPEYRKKCPKCKSKNLKNTTSALIINYLDFLRIKKPKFAIFENVKNLTGKIFKETFDLFVKEIKSYGYNIYYKVLNAKEYGIPQNRERVFAVIIRKDIDNGTFKFPKPLKETPILKDILVDIIENKYLFNDDLKIKLLNSLSDEVKEKLYKKTTKIQKIGSFDVNGFRQATTVSGINGICPCLTTMAGGNTQPKILLPVCCASRGRNPDNPNSRIVGLPTEQRLEINCKNITNTLTTVSKDNYILDLLDKKHEIEEFDPLQFILRKLTPLECFRLMGFSDEDFEHAKYYTEEEVKLILNKNPKRKLKKELDKNGKERYTYLSDSQAYKQAGNSIVVNVILEIFKELYIAMPELFKDLKVMSVFSGIGAFENALDKLQNITNDINNCNNENF